MNSAEATRAAHEWLVASGLYHDVIRHAGAYDSKLEPEENASLAAHLLNATTVAVNSFVYEAFAPGDEIMAYEEPIRVLAGATVLHDTNKYVREAYGADMDGNTRAAFDRYFDEGDDFGVEAFVGEGYREDLLYLVQRTEINEDSRETRRTETEFRGLERYARLGDQAASIAQRDGIHGVYRRLAEEFGDDYTHLIEFTRIEQPVLNELLIAAVKEVIAGDGDDGRSAPSGVVIGSTPGAVVYLGDAIDREQLRDRVERRVSERILDEFEFSCKLGWGKFGYEGLAVVDTDPSEKEQIIADAFRDLLVGDDETANREQFESIPEEFDQWFAPLVKALYVDKRSDFAEIDPEIQAEYDQIYEDVGGQKVKFYFAAHLVERYLDDVDGTEAFLDQLAAETRPALHADMKPEQDPVAPAAARFFGDASEIGTTPPASKDAMCFLCGAAADEEYAKGRRAIYQTYAHSRRVPPQGERKAICGTCNIEHALFEHICELNDISPNNEIEVAYFSFDDFLGDVRVRSRRVGSPIQDDTVDLDDLDVSTSLVAPQYHMQPFYISGKDQRMRTNHRMHVVRRILQTAQQSGMKVTISRPFTRFTTSDSVVVDQEATRPEVSLGINEIERFGPLPAFAREGRENEHDHEPTHLRRAVHLLDVMATVGGIGEINNPYLALDRDEFVELCSLAVRKAVQPSAQGKPSRPANLPETVRSYINTYHGDSLMDMETIVRRGIDLFGQDKYGSKHAKTRGFREALDVFMTGYGENADRERILTDAKGAVYAIAQREDYAGRTTPEQADRFVEAIAAYLREENLDDLSSLSARQNALVDTYYYTHDKVSFESDGDESDANAEREAESGA